MIRIPITRRDDTQSEPNSSPQQIVQSKQYSAKFPDIFPLTLYYIMLKW